MHSAPDAVQPAEACCLQPSQLQVHAKLVWWTSRDKATSMRDNALDAASAAVRHSILTLCAHLRHVFQAAACIFFRRNHFTPALTGLMGRGNWGPQWDDVFLATRTGQTSTVQRIISRRPDYLNKVSSDDGTTLVYHAARCGHIKVLQYLLKAGGQADWQRTYMASCCPIIRAMLKPYVIAAKKKQAAILVIRKHLAGPVHSWLWKPVTRDGKRGVFARLLVKDMLSAQADGFRQWTKSLVN